ncbi:MAG: PhnA domain-containing protein [Pseudomonadota bacterium]|nr:PhnA domain-containing protein [Pseudomonadota bacterium]
MNTEQALLQRCNASCELCTSTANLVVYELPPVTDAGVENSIMICEVCNTQISAPETMDVNHWRCLSGSMWSQVPAVQVVVWRLLKQLSTESWAQDLLDSLYLDEETQKWAEASSAQSDEVRAPTFDSNGAELKDGDTVTIIKDLDVKGANFTAKRGTAVRNISLTSNPEHIEGRVNGVRIVLLTCFLKKSG